MDRWWKASLLLLLTLGCGKTVAGEDPTQDVGVPPPYTTDVEGSAICSGLGLEADAPLLVVGDGPDLWLVHANGALTALDHGFGAEYAPDAPIEIVSVRIAGDYALVWGRVGDDSYVPPYELALFARDGRRLWHHRPQSFDWGMITNIFLDARGFVAYSENSVEFSEQTVILSPSGESFVDLGSVPLSTPNARGWMAIARSEPYAHSTSYGFLHPSDGSYVATRFEPLPGVMQPLRGTTEREETSLIYITQQTPTLSAVLETVNEAHVFELRGLVPPDPSETGFRIQQGKRWAIITNNGLPVLRIDLDARQAFAVDAGALAEEPYASVVDGGDRFVATAASRVLWRLDARTGSFLPVDALGALRRLNASYCGTSQFAAAEDGRLAIALRDDDSGGIFLEQLGGQWTRLGMPFLGVTYARANQQGEGWLISTDDGSNTYCPPAIEGPGAQPPPAGTVVGDALQVVLPERGLVRALRLDEERLSAVHSSALCVAYAEGTDLVLYDPVSDTSQVLLSSNSEAYIWNPPSAFF